MAQPLVGIFVGGRGRRMGGRDKSQLPAPGGAHTLLSRWLEVIEAAGLPDVVLVGGAGDATTTGAQAPPALRRLADDPPGVGPIGGLSALLREAGARPAIVLACDMPYAQPALLARLACEHPEAAALAPRDPRSGKWQALFARYDAVRARAPIARVIDDGERSLQAALAAVGCRELALDPGEHAQLRDWDTPSDVTS